jgi:hypothetical protein
MELRAGKPLKDGWALAVSGTFGPLGFIGARVWATAKLYNQCTRE